MELRLIYTGGIVLIFGIFTLVGMKFGYIKLNKKRKIQNKSTKLYDQLSKIMVVKNELFVLYEAIYDTYNLEEDVTKNYAASIFVRNLCRAIIISGFVYVISKTMFIVMAVFIFTLRHLNRRYSNDIENLGAQITATDKLQKKYKESNKIVLKTLEVSMRAAKPSAKRDFNNIHDLLSLKTDEASVIFKDKTKNKYMRMLGSYLLIVDEEGDDEIDGTSTFYTNIASIISEMRNEYRKMYNISKNIAYEKVFILSTIFLIPYLKSFSLNMGNSIKANQVDRYFNSSWGSFALVISLVVMLASYYMYNSFIEVDTGGSIKRGIKLDVVLLKNKFVKRVIKKITPVSGHKNYKKIRNRMLYAGKLEKLEYFYLRKVTWTLLLVVLMSAYILVTQISLVKQTENSLEFGLEQERMYENIIKMKGGLERQEEDRIIKQDLEMIDVIKAHNLDEDKLLEYLVRNQVKGFLSSQHMARRLISKSNEIDRLRGGSLGKIAIILMVALLGYKYENFRITLLSKLKREVFLFDEMMSFQTIILVQMNNNKATSIDCLNQMIEFSTIFYQQLVEARDDCRTKSVKESLELLKIKVDYEPLNDLIDGLILADEDLSLYDSFESLRADKIVQIELRRDNTERLIELKSSIMHLLGSFSPLITMLFFFFIPIGITFITTLMESKAAYDMVIGL